MKKILVLFVVSMLVLSACSGGLISNSDKTSTPTAFIGGSESTATAIIATAQAESLLYTAQAEALAKKGATTPTPTPLPTSTPLPTDTPTVPPTFTPTATTLRATDTPVPATGFQPQGLVYQYPTGCAAAAQAGLDPMVFPACILQRVQSGELTGETAVAMIQKLGTQFNAPSFEAISISFANRQPVLAWCPDGVAFYPPDTALPLVGTKGEKWANLLFVVDGATDLGPDRVIEAVAGSTCWVVYRK